MLPTVGEVCKFNLKPRFSDLSGIYRVLSIHMLTDLIDQGIDLFKSVYKRVGLSETDYETDYDEFKHQLFYKLQDVTDEENVIYLSSFFNASIPDPNVHEYLKLAFAVNIGVFDDVDKINWIKDQIQQSLAYITGDDVAPDLFELAPVWLTETEYEAIETERQNNISEVSNHFTDKLKLIEENNRLRALVASYEQTIINSQP